MAGVMRPEGVARGLPGAPPPAVLSLCHFGLVFIPWPQSGPLAVADSFFANRRIGVPMAMAPGELSELRGRGAQHPDRDRIENRRRASAARSHC
jgi:hypothetical protein